MTAGIIQVSRNNLIRAVVEYKQQQVTTQGSDDYDTQYTRPSISPLPLICQLEILGSSAFESN